MLLLFFRQSDSEPVADTEVSTGSGGSNKRRRRVIVVDGRRYLVDEFAQEVAPPNVVAVENKEVFPVKAAEIDGRATRRLLEKWEKDIRDQIRDEEDFLLLI